MISGGGVGRKYLPKAKAVAAMAVTITRGLVTLRPSRNAQSSHRAPASQLRQPLRVILAPQFAQKFERLIVGVLGKQPDYISKFTEPRVQPRTIQHAEYLPRLVYLMVIVEVLPSVPRRVTDSWLTPGAN